MKRMGSLALAAPLLLLASCKQAPDTAAGNNTAHTLVAAQHTPKAPLDDAALRNQLPGAWVSSDKRPTGDPKDICATDNGITLDEDGGFASYDEEGHWIVEHGELVITATMSIPDFDEENASEKPINPPRVMRWPIEELDGNLLRLRAEKEQFWMFRCPHPAKG